MDSRSGRGYPSFAAGGAVKGREKTGFSMFPPGVDFEGAENVSRRSLRLRKLSAVLLTIDHRLRMAGAGCAGCATRALRKGRRETAAAPRKSTWLVAARVFDGVERWRRQLKPFRVQPLLERIPDSFIRSFWSMLVTHTLSVSETPASSPRSAVSGFQPPGC